MNTLYKKIITSICCFIVGIIVFMLHQEYLLINMHIGQQKYQKPALSIKKKIAKIFFWQHDAWQAEDTEILWSDDKTDALHYLINRWLSILEEEHILHKKITLQLVALTATDQAIISFDRNPFNKESSTFEKIMLIESLLKTIRDNGIKIQSIRCLVNHAPVNDYHLDFCMPWPITGFVSSST